MVKITKKDADNLLETLEEWHEESSLGVKELDKNDVGLDSERYDLIYNKLTIISKQ